MVQRFSPHDTTSPLTLSALLSPPPRNFLLPSLSPLLPLASYSASSHRATSSHSSSLTPLLTSLHIPIHSLLFSNTFPLISHIDSVSIHSPQTSTQHPSHDLLFLSIFSSHTSPHIAFSLSSCHLLARLSHTLPHVASVLILALSKRRPHICSFLILPYPLKPSHLNLLSYITMCHHTPPYHSLAPHSLTTPTSAHYISLVKVHLSLLPLIRCRAGTA